MSISSVIVISPTSFLEGESSIINGLMESGIHRYHIDKHDTTEQAIAEILEGVQPKYVGQITLHSHFHLVLAYGVGGIHYSAAQRKVVGNDYTAKVNLYRGFGVKVSTSITSLNEEWKPADYVLINAAYQGSQEGIFPIIDDFETLSSTSNGAVSISDKKTADNIIQRLKGK